MSKMASSGVDPAEVKQYLNCAIKLARRVEAQKSVTGFLGGSLTEIIEQVLNIATPLASMSGDFELSNLLGSLKVWLDKKKAEKAQQTQQQEDMFNQGYSDLNFTYAF
jgi:hypothetical protein